MVTVKDERAEVSRRNFLSYGIGACLAFLGTLLGIPAIGAAVGPALRRSEAGWIHMGRVDSFPDGVPTAAEFIITRKDGWVEAHETKSVWVVRQGAQVTVFNGRCTHLGCAYSWQPDRSRFFSPCHAGVFAMDGRVVAGPPPRPLDPLPIRVEAGNLLIQYLDFRLGVAERVPA